jgi:AcrR family transcriptional regulator
MSTKQKILNQALQQFNTDGVEKITTRHIAKELGISQGNLHYHFPNKEALILQLFENFLHEIEGAKQFPESNLQNPEDVIGTMTKNFEIMLEYQFLFRDNEVVWRRVPQVKVDIIKLFQSVKMRISELVSSYKQNGTLRTEISDAQLNFLADQFVFNISTWLVGSTYVGKIKNSHQFYAKTLFRLWLPYLTVKEMLKWERILE